MSIKDKKPLQSKKFIALTVGVGFTTFFTLLGMILMVINPSVSSSIVNIMTVSLASINGVIGLYSIGQSAVDWRINSQHTTTQENKISKLLNEVKGGKEVNYDSLEPIEWSEKDDKKL